ncbi:Rha family transcriptional regulator [Oceanimonas smirnovii]|uniref:Rha family transcriptional regulator n=1 Tax=Oceanimonas smirnovii TaxID=264574 RepID=UPI000364CF2E|nr:phage regulatory protein/antirepressor Ant [Oceanimonas smirnovii]
MNELINRSAELTMSSMDIAELCEKRHDHVMRDIRKMLEELDLPTPQFSGVYRADNGQQYECFNLPRRECDILMAGYSIRYRAVIVDRWRELERYAAEGPKLPTTFAEALRLAAEQAERLEQQQAQLAQAAPKVAFVDRYVDATGLQNLSNVAKMLSFGPIKFSRLLAEDGILYRSGGALVPKQEFIDKGLFRIKTGEANGHSWMQTKVTSKGVDWLAQRYATEVVGA